MNVRNLVPTNTQHTRPAGSGRAASSVRRTSRHSQIGRKCRSLMSSEEGSPLIEFAFVLPLMMICLTGMFTFGVAIYNAINLTQATGVAAQRLQQVRGTTTDPCGDALTALEGAAPTLTPSGITLSLSINGGSATTAHSCTGQATTFNNAVGQPFTLSTTYPCTLAVYGLNLGGCSLSAQLTEYAY